MARHHPKDFSKLIKEKIIIVGAFPKGNKEIYGGILQSCKIILDSSLSKNFNLITVDSTQISNPPANLIVRFFYAVKRIAEFTYKLIIERPKVALIFTSDGLSAIEKGFMCFISSFTNCNSIIFPRAGNLIHQTKNSKIFKIVIRYLFKKAKIFLCQGDGWKNFAHEELGFEGTQLKIINNWTATKKLIQIGEQRNFEKKNESIRILFVGWLEEYKGVFELLEASKELIDDGYKFNIVFAGDGHAKNKAKMFIKNNNLLDYVELYGWADEQNLHELYSKNDIFILPSWSEGLPNSMIEAMSAGLSVIVSNVGVIPDFIENNKNGLIIEPKNKDSLKSAMTSLLNDKNLLKKIAINGHNFSKNKFSSEIGIKRLLFLMEEIINKK